MFCVFNSPFVNIIDVLCVYRWASTRREDTADGDVWDGSVMKKVPPLERKSTLFFGWCNDAAVFKRFKEESYSPWVMECFNIAPEHRYTFSCLFFIALLPQSVQDYNSLYGHVLDQMAVVNAFSGFPVTDENGVESILKIKMVRKVLHKHKTSNIVFCLFFFVFFGCNMSIIHVCVDGRCGRTVHWFV